MEGSEDDLAELAANIVFEQMPEPVREEKSTSDEARKRLIKAANQVFGWLNWNHAVLSQNVDYIDCNNGLYSVGVSSVVRIEVKGGTYHQEVGYGTSDGLRSKIQCISQARQDSVLNGIRLALLSFGGDIAEILLNPKNCIEKSKKRNNLQQNGETTPEKKPLVQLFPDNQESTPSTSVKSARKSSTLRSSPVLAAGNNKAVTEEDSRLERKRRQQQKQEQFRQQFKQQKLFHGSSNKSNPLKTSDGLIDKMNTCEWPDVIDTPLAEEEFLSTQEVEKMVQTKVAPLLAVPTDIRSPKDFSAMRPDSFIPRKPQLNTKRSI